MKVWVAEKSYDYEGSDVIGVFAKKEDAIAHCQKHFKDLYEGEVELDFTTESDNNGTEWVNAEYGSLFYHVISWDVQV